MVSCLVAVLLKQPFTPPLPDTRLSWIRSLLWFTNSCAGSEAKVGMSGSAHAAEPGTGAAEIAVEPQSPLPNLPPLLTEVQGQVCGIGGIFQNENIVYKNDPLIFHQKVLLMWSFLTKTKVAAYNLQIYVQEKLWYLWRGQL